MPKTAVITKSREELLEDMTNLSLKEIKDKEARFEQITKQLFSEADKVQASNLKVCFLLLQISDYQLWKCKGGSYQTLYDYAENNFEMSKTSLNERLFVARRFGVYTEVTVMNGNNKPVTKYVPQYKLNPIYKDFGFKQLYIMRNLSDREIETIGIKPEMSCRNIKGAICKYENGLTSEDSDTEKANTDLGVNDKKEDDTSPMVNSLEYDDYYPSLIRSSNKVLVFLEDIFTKPLKLPELPDGYDYVISLIDSKNICITKKEIQV